MDVENVIIIGSGPAGLSAAIYTSREGFGPLVIAGEISGGQLLLTTTVENMPGFPNGVQGPELIDLMTKQAERFGTRFVHENVTDVDFTSRPLKVRTSAKEYLAHSVIVATGANAKMLGIPAEAKHIGMGVSTCATCDGPFFKGKDVVVVGGGDTAMEDSFFLTKFCTSVTIIHRKDTFRASKIMQSKVLSSPKIKVLWNSELVDITDAPGGGIAGVSVKNVLNGQVTNVPAGGVFIAIGHMPSTGFLKGKLPLDEAGYVITKDEVMTDIPGVFVAGDNVDKYYRQAGTASAAGIKAALRAREFLQGTKV